MEAKTLHKRLVPILTTLWVLGSLSPSSLKAKTNAQVNHSDDQAYQEVKKKLQGRGDHIIRNIKRLGDQTIGLEAFISADMDLNYAPDILSQFSKYRTWLLNGINDRPSGGKYYVQFEDFVAPPGNPALFSVLFNLDLPVFKLRGIQKFNAKAFWSGNKYVMQARGIRSKKSVIVSSDLDLMLYSGDAPGRVWAHLKAKVKVRDWLLYAALPEKVLNREVSDRFRIILKNYLKEEDRIYNASKLNRSPKERMGASVPGISAPLRK